MTVTVKNTKGPIAGVRVEFTTDYGAVSPANAVTNAQGQATTKLLGVEASAPPDDKELPVLAGVAQKVANARTQTAIAYSTMKFEPLEMSVISKYSPSSTFVDIERNLGEIRIIPPGKTATVSCYAKQGTSIVRGIGTSQITFSQWVRDWIKTKVADTIKEVDVSSRVGAKFGGAWKAEEKDFEVKRINEGIFDVYSDVAFEAQGKLVKNVFTDIVPDDDLGKAGVVAQTIAAGGDESSGAKDERGSQERNRQFFESGVGAVQGGELSKDDSAKFEPGECGCGARVQDDVRQRRRVWRVNARVDTRTLSRLVQRSGWDARQTGGSQTSSRIVHSTYLRACWRIKPGWTIRCTGLWARATLGGMRMRPSPTRAYYVFAP